MATSWNTNGEVASGLVIEGAVVLQGTPAVGIDMDVGILDYVSFFFDLTRAAATSIEWWFEGYDGEAWYRLPANVDAGTPPGVTHADGEHTRAQAASGTWGHENVRVTGLKGIRINVDSTAGTTDTISVRAYGEALSGR